MYMLDTNICIYVISKNHRNSIAVDNVAKHIGEDLCISSVTLSELEYGICKSIDPDKNRKALYQFLSSIPVIDYDSEAAKEYGDIRSSLEKAGTPIGPLDMMIAAHARSRGYVLVTNNSREFDRVSNLRVENWAE